MKNRIGIVGGGQLARMMIPPAKQLGFTVTVLDPTPKSPAGQLADEQIIADLNDETAMMRLAKQSDFVTLDWELANPDLLEKIVRKGVPVNPSPKTLRIIKDKYEQKVFLKKNNIPVADFREIKTLQDIEQGAKIFGYPFLLKAKIGAYDGKGNYLVKTKHDIKKGLEKLTLGIKSSHFQSYPEQSEGSPFYIERFVPFIKELAIMVARDEKGTIVTYPVVETIHKNNILHITLSPAEIDKKINKKVKTLAIKTMRHLQGAGVFGIEMFLTPDGKVLINEIAPRVHNSGHYSIEACSTSQFEQHIRAITGLPLGKTDMKTNAAVMINILGERNGKAEVKGLEKILRFPHVSVHIYGKADTKIERKMGHITVIGNSLQECLQKAKKTRKLITI